MQQLQEMGLLPHSARTTSCPPPCGCVPRPRDTHSCAVFVCCSVITSSSQSSAISSKPSYLCPPPPLSFPPLSLAGFLCCSVRDGLLMCARGGTRRGINHFPALLFSPVRAIKGFCPVYLPTCMLNLSLWAHALN